MLDTRRLMIFIAFFYVPGFENINLIHRKTAFGARGRYDYHLQAGAGNSP